MSAFQITPAHAAIFQRIEAGDCSLMISAVAGAGKTSTIIEALKRVPAGKSTLFLAFNKRIVVELEKRVPAGVTVMTLNAMGHQALMGHLRSMGILAKVDKDKTRHIAKQIFSEAEMQRWGSAAIKLVGLGKSAGILPRGLGLQDGLTPDLIASWRELAKHHDIELNDKVDVDEVCAAATTLLRESCSKTDVIDFDDQLLLAHGMGAPLTRFDAVFVDESQDCNALQHALIERAIAPGGHLIAVGDPHQAIYGFRGADSNSMANMVKKFSMVELPLHVSYRCPQSVVAVAQRYVSHIQAHASAPMGTVVEKAVSISQVEMRPGDMVICRTNAPVVRAAYSLLRKGIPCVVLGRDIGKGIQQLIKKLKPVGLDDLTKQLQKWEDAERAKAIKAENANKQSAIEDKAETVRVFIDVSADLDDLNARIESMFSDAAPESVVTCCSIHKSKGLEAERVFIVDFHKMPSKYAKQKWQQEQENNLIYVATTRAKSHLQMVINDTSADVGAAPMRDAAAPTISKMEMVVITGNTYPVKDAIKALGGRWDAASKTWSVPAANADRARALVAGRQQALPSPTPRHTGLGRAPTYLPAKWRSCGYPGCRRGGQCDECNGAGGEYEARN